MLVKYTTHLNGIAQKQKQQTVSHMETLVEERALSAGHLFALCCFVLEHAKAIAKLTDLAFCSGG